MNLYGQPINLFATTAFGVSCFLLGAVLALVLLSARKQPKEPAPQRPLDDGDNGYIDRMASEWARREGKTTAHANVAGSYAKLAVQLQERLQGGGR